jgi:hypothetical protein
VKRGEKEGKGLPVVKAEPIEEIPALAPEMLERSRPFCVKCAKRPAHGFSRLCKECRRAQRHQGGKR